MHQQSFSGNIFVKSFLFQKLSFWSSIRNLLGRNFFFGWAEGVCQMNPFVTTYCPYGFHKLNGFHSTKYTAKLSCIWPVNTSSETEIGNAQTLCRVFSFLSPQIGTGHQALKG